jgi:mono/diheme cytochrome c family protein
MNSSKWQGLLVLSTIVLLTIACSSFFRAPSASNRRSDEGEESLLNGESIYFTASNLEGDRITPRGAPDFGGMMMGSYLTCAACHGPEARGGVHVMHMQVMDAPDIRYSALSEEMEEHGTEDSQEHADEHAGYDLEDFRMAVIEGKHPDGEALSSDMPRWKMSDQDLQYLFEFLKSIP